MTTQQRHIKAAEKVICAFMDDPSAISIRGILTPMVALAIEEAENRAAWRVWEKCATLCDIDKTMREISEDYGPRPSRGEVGNE